MKAVWSFCQGKKRYPTGATEVSKRVRTNYQIKVSNDDDDDDDNDDGIWWYS